MSKEAESRMAPLKSDPPQAGTLSPGDFIHYKMNLLALFRDVATPGEIDRLAHAAVANRDSAMRSFSRRLRHLAEGFLRERSASGRAPEHAPPPLLRGWQADRIREIQAQHGGLLMALFHFGEHRQVFADLACLGIPFIAPVAKQAYFECDALARQGPAGFEHAMELLEVEDRKVGRRLIQGLRSGRVGVIYVDGNMGPDGHLVEEGAVEVAFLGSRIRVKAGIARLSQSLGFPVLPLLVRGTADDDAQPAEILLGDLISPPERDAEGRDGAQQRLMQHVYDELATAVRKWPEKWEFAFCFHRWVTTSKLTRAEIRPSTHVLTNETKVEVPPRNVVLYSRDGSDFWVHVGRQKAYRMPAWATGLHELLTTRDCSAGAATLWLQAHGASTEEDAITLLRGLAARDLAVLSDPTRT